MTKTKTTIFIFLTAVFVVTPTAQADDDDSPGFERLMHKLQNRSNVMEFSEAEIFLEQNATDADTEVVLLAKGR